jgi:hypothetical protein
VVVVITAFLVLGVPGSAMAATQLSPVSYTAQDGHKETLTPWQGQHVTVLVEPGSRDPAVMGKLVGALDRAWNYYAATTGRTPHSNRFTLHGRDEIAEVSSMNPPNSCGGAACTYIGQTGTETLTQYFESGYQQIAQHNLYDQPLFYELGRSFWFWGDQLAFKSPDSDPVVTGFAVLMRFQSMAAAGVNGAPFNSSTPFNTFKSQVAALAGQYEANPSLTFAQTLAQNKSPGAYGGTDFWASLMMQLAARHGGQEFLNRFFRRASSQAAASQTRGAVANWQQAASYAACVNLSSVFYRRWGFPQPNGTVSARPLASAVPEPPGSCIVYFGGDIARFYRVRPSSIHITSNENLRSIRWSDWGRRTAHGRGTAVFSRATRLPSSPVGLTLSNVHQCGPRQQYLRLRIAYLRGGPFGRSATINYTCTSPFPTTTRSCSIPGGAEGGADLPFTTAGLTCTQGRPVVTGGFRASGPCGTSKSGCAVHGFTCRLTSPGRAQPGSQITCRRGTQEVRFRLPG